MAVERLSLQKMKNVLGTGKATESGDGSCVCGEWGGGSRETASGFPSGGQRGGHDFNTGFIEIAFTYHTFHPFKVCNPVVLSTFRLRQLL